MIVLLRISPRPHHADLHLAQARAAQVSGDLQSASDHLFQAAESLPGQPGLWERAGQAALQAGDSQSAIYRLEIAAARRGLSLQGMLALGDAFLALGDMPRAMEIWQGTLPSPDGYTRLAAAHKRAADYPAALADLQALLETQPRDAGLLYQIGLLMTATQPEGAMEYLEQAAALDTQLAEAVRNIGSGLREARGSPEPAYAFVAAGRGLAAAGEWELAAEAFRRSIEIRPDWAEAWAFLGEARQHRSGSSARIRQEALHALQKAISLDANSLSANLFLALYWDRNGSSRLALHYIQRASATDPLNPILQAEIGSFLSEMGNLPEAQDFYQRAIDLEPSNPVFWRFLADFSLRHGIQIRQIALPAARRAVILAPHDPTSLDVMAHTLLLLGDYLNAERFLQRALQADPAYAAAYLHLGMNAYLQGDPINARQKLDIAIMLAPQSNVAEQARRFLQRYLP